VVRARATLHRLMVVVADRVLLGQVLQDGRVAFGHVVVAHLHGALVDRGRRHGAVVVARGVGHPGGEVVAVGALLPHLVEAVQRVADEGAVELAAAGVLQVAVVVRDVLGDLVRRVGQVGGEPLVRGVLGLAVATRGYVRRVRLRQACVGARDRRAERVRLGVGSSELDRLLRVRAEAAAGGDDPLGQQVVDVLSLAGLVGGEDVVEGVVLTDDHDDVLDRRRGGAEPG